MKRTITLLFFWVPLTYLIPLDAISQEDRSKNNLYLELGGNGIFYSFNYERALSEDIFGRVGFSVWETKGEALAGTREISGTGMVIPVMINFLAGEGKGRFEIGGGISIFTHSSDLESDITFDSDTVLLTTTLGYRIQPVNGGFLFKIGVTAMTNFDEVLPWAGLSLGYSF